MDHTTQGRFVLIDRDVEQIVGMPASQLAQKVAEVNDENTHFSVILTMEFLT
jgi:hypothetical protein